jgi:hypothetical protein
MHPKLYIFQANTYFLDHYSWVINALKPDVTDEWLVLLLHIQKAQIWISASRLAVLMILFIVFLSLYMNVVWRYLQKEQKQLSCQSSLHNQHSSESICHVGVKDSVLALNWMSVVHCVQFHAVINYKWTYEVISLCHSKYYWDSLS